MVGTSIILLGVFMFTVVVIGRRCRIGMQFAQALPIALGQARDRCPTIGDIEARPGDLAGIAQVDVFAFNIAPTEEVRKMTIEADPRLFPVVLLFSLGVSYLFVFLADFADRGAIAAVFDLIADKIEDFALPGS